MARFEINIVNEKDKYIEFGKLLRDWASPNGRKVPTTVGELRAQAGTLIELVGNPTDDQSITILMLPAKDGAHIVVPHFSELDPQNLPQDYGPPDFYGKMNENEPVSLTIAEADREDFQLARIADYSMRKCV